MSRLLSNIARLEAQRACLDLAVSMVGDLAGPVLELGLGNGRTYDHLRVRLPERDIFVFERQVASHPDCVPPTDRLILGDLRETLPAASARFPQSAALAHVDIATHDRAASERLAVAVAPMLTALMRKGAVIVSELPLPVAHWRALPSPREADGGRYHMYQAG
jgi:S-adenosyl-L-methionine methyltransferase